MGPAKGQPLLIGGPERVTFQMRLLMMVMMMTMMSWQQISKSGVGGRGGRTTPLAKSNTAGGGDNLINVNTTL